MIIDTHAHFLPGHYPEHSPECFPIMEPIEGSTGRLLVFGEMRFPAKAAFFDAEARVEAQDASGVDVEVISPMPPLLNVTLPAVEALDLARWVNDYAAGMQEAGGGRIIALGMVPLQDPQAAAGELAAIAERGLAGVEVPSNINGASLGDERFLPFFQEAARRDLSVFAHAMPAPDPRLPMSAMGTYVVGAEGQYSAASLILGGTSDAVPELRLSFSGAAGGFPFLLPRHNYFWSGTWNDEPKIAERAFQTDDGPSPIEKARRFWYDATVFDRRAIRYLVELLGADRLLVGSDFPAMPREEPIARSLRSLELPDAQWQDISWRNAMRWLGREAA